MSELDIERWFLLLYTLVLVVAVIHVAMSKQ